MKKHYNGLREKLLELYDLDINETKTIVSTPKHMLVFPGASTVVTVICGEKASLSQMKIIHISHLKLLSA